MSIWGEALKNMGKNVGKNLTPIQQARLYAQQKQHSFIPTESSQTKKKVSRTFGDLAGAGV